MTAREWHSVVTELRADEINVDTEIQRMLERPRVQRMAENLNEDALGIITVSKRADGRLFIVDGQHRLASVILAGGEDLLMRAELFEGLTRAQEAKLFRERNNMRKPNVFDIFRARLVEGDPVALDINRLFEKYGWHLSMGGADGSISAVAAAERIYRLEALALERALYALTEAWGHKTESTDGRVLEGLGLFFFRYGDAVEVDDLVGKLSAHAGGPMGVVGKANSIKELTKKPVSRCFAQYVTDLYNKKKKTRALSSYEGE